VSAPIESKVSAATIATAASGLAVWALQTYAFHGELPLPVAAAVTTVVPALCAFIAGWAARHTPRPDLQANPAVDGRREHALDGDPGEIPASLFDKPSGTRYDGDKDPRA
jgi:hypothetical protein